MSSGSSVLFVDCEDSFSWNIVAEIEKLGFDVHVLRHDDVRLTSDLSATYKIWVWGPGPGHPLEYPHLIELMNKLSCKKVFHFGICLGHQLLGISRGGNVVSCLEPLHGQTREIRLAPWPDIFPMALSHTNIRVQHYNSLALIAACDLPAECREFIVSGESLMSSGPNYLSYQFHPESIGTNFRELFFGPLMKFKGIIKPNGPTNKTQRHLRPANS